MIRKALAAAATAAAVAAPLAIAAPAQAADPIGNGNPYDFDIVTTAIAATGVALPETYTAFLPNDRAFEVLANNLGLLGAGYKYGAQVDEDKILSALVVEVGDENLQGDLTLDQVEEVLKYHVVAAYLPGETIVSKRFWNPTMANGQSLQVYVLSKTAPYIVLADKDGRFFNDFVVKSKVNVRADGKVAWHGISDVLLPKM